MCLRLEKETYASVFAFVLGLQCVYSAVCAVILKCVSYDVPEPDEVYSAGAGVSVSSI